MKSTFIVAALLAATAALPTAAAAQVTTTTISLNDSEDTTDSPFGEFTQSFVLPTVFTNARLNITSFLADDAAVANLNGTNLLGVGIFGPGNGNFFFSANGPSTPFTFATNGPQGLTFSGPFTAGINTFTLFVNNNNAGINRENGPLTGGPGRVEFVGNVQFDTGVAAAVPEPATWGMMILGFGAMGAAMRRRKVRTTVSFA